MTAALPPQVRRAGPLAGRRAGPPDGRGADGGVRQRGGRRPDARDGARHVLQSLPRRALGEGQDERQHDRRPPACSSTATPTASLYSSEPHGPTCHTGAASCFFQTLEGTASSRRRPSCRRRCSPRSRLCSSRARARRVEASYTKSLYDAGALPRSARRSARRPPSSRRRSQGESDDRVVSEAADTLYHVLVGLRWRAIPLRRVLAELARRAGHERPSRRKRGGCRRARTNRSRGIRSGYCHVHQSSRVRERPGLRGRAPERARKARLQHRRRRRRQRGLAAGIGREARPDPAVDRAAADERLLGLQQAEEGPGPQGRPAHHHVERVERRDLRAAQEAADARRGLRPQAHRLRRAAPAHPDLRPARQPEPPPPTPTAIVIDDEIEVGSTDYMSDDDGHADRAARRSMAAATATTRGMRTVDADVDAFADAAFGRLTGSSRPARARPSRGAPHPQRRARARSAAPAPSARAHAAGRARAEPAPTRVDVAEYEKLRERAEARPRPRRPRPSRSWPRPAARSRSSASRRRENERLRREVEELRVKLAAGGRRPAASRAASSSICARRSTRRTRRSSRSRSSSRRRTARSSRRRTARSRSSARRPTSTTSLLALERELAEAQGEGRRSAGRQGSREEGERGLQEPC